MKLNLIYHTVHHVKYQKNQITVIVHAVLVKLPYQVQDNQN
jgi:hypothetical protein